MTKKPDKIPSPPPNVEPTNKVVEVKSSKPPVPTPAPQNRSISLAREEKSKK